MAQGYRSIEARIRLRLNVKVVRLNPKVNASLVSGSPDMASRCNQISKVLTICLTVFTLFVAWPRSDELTWGRHPRRVSGWVHDQCLADVDVAMDQM